MLICELDVMDGTTEHTESTEIEVCGEMVVRDEWSVVRGQSFVFVP
jgi:hypothetical protein